MEPAAADILFLHVERQRIKQTKDESVKGVVGFLRASDGRDARSGQFLSVERLVYYLCSARGAQSCVVECFR
jgi:hypothetical protein